MPGSPVFDIRNSFGAAFVGLLVSTVLLGLTIAQTWIYFWNYRNRDSKPLRFLVAFVTFLDVLHTIICAYAIYWYLVLNFGNVENLEYSMWALNLQVILSIVIGACVQIFYARRVYIVSKSVIYPILIVALIAIASFFGIFFTVKQAIHTQFSSFHSLTWMTYIGLSAVTVGDILVATSMCWSLYRRRTGFARTDSIILTLMAYSLNSGLLTGLATTISFVSSPSSLIWVAFFWTMSKCYANSLLATLNSRDYIRGRQPTTNKQDNAYNISSIRIEPLSDARVSLSVQRTTATTLDYGRNKSGHDQGPTFEVPKPDAKVILFQSQAQALEPSV